MDRVRARRRPMAEINVVPYIDVMLVLLVIFMITAPLLNLGVEVELPKADAEPMDTQENDEPLVITVLKNGDLYLNAGGDLDGTSSGLIDPESLLTMVTARKSRCWWVATNSLLMGRFTASWCCCKKRVLRKWA